MNATRYAGLFAIWLLAITHPAGAQGVDTVRVGSAALHEFRPHLGVYTIESFHRIDGRDTPLSTTIQAISQERRGEVDVYVVHTTHVSEGDTTVGVIVARASDLALLHHRVTATRDSAAVSVTHGYLTGWVALPDEPVRLIDEPLEGAVFPVEGQVPWLFPLLPLTEGYAAAVPHYSQWEARETWSSIRVVAAEWITVGGRDFDCWRVDGGELFAGYGVTYWIDKDTRRVVRGIARGPAGGPEFWSRMRVP
jgi:hypothetical protein